MLRIELPVDKINELCAEYGLPPGLDADLRSVVDSVFLASLEQYEGVPALASAVLLIADPKSTSVSIEFNADLSFDEPLELSPENLRALSPALSENNVLLIARSPEQPRIIGIGEAREGLWVSSPTPGRVTVRARKKIGVFDWRRSDVFQDLADTLRKMIEERARFEDGRKSYDWAQTITALLHRMTRQGRGGAIVLVPSAVVLGGALETSRFTLRGASSRFLSAANAGYDHYRAMRAQAKTEHYASERGEYFDSRAAADAMSNSQLQADLEHEAGLEALCRLTALDGAVILNYGFEVVAFGAKLNVSESPAHLCIVDVITGNKRVGSMKEVNGTRHQSALRFVSAVDHSIAFVCSQDGGVSMATREDTTVVWFRNVELALMTMSSGRQRNRFPA